MRWPAYDTYLQPRVYIRFEDNVLWDDVFRNLIRLSYDQSVEKAGMLTLDLSNGATFLDDFRFMLDKHIFVRVGYKTSMTPLFSTVIKEIRPIFTETGIVSYSINAYDLSIPIKNGGVAKNWGKKTSSQIAREIAKRYRYDIYIEDSKDVPKRDRIQPGKFTDMEYLGELAAALDWDCYINGTTLVFKPKELPHNIDWEFDYLGGQTSILQSFNPVVKSYITPSASSAGMSDTSKKPSSNSQTSGPGPGSTGVNPDAGISKGHRAEVMTAEQFAKVKPQVTPGKAKQPNVQTHNSDGTAKTEVQMAEQKLEGSVAALNNKLNEIREGRLNPDPEGESEIQKKMNELAAKRKKIEVDANASFIGQPGFELRQVLKFNGLGSVWSGKYRILSIQHEYSDKGFHTEVGLKRIKKNEGAGAGSGNAGADKKKSADEEKAGKTRVWHVTPEDTIYEVIK